MRNKAIAVGALGWLEDLPELVADLEQRWSIRVGRTYEDSTEAFVAEAMLEDGTPAVLKLLVPRADDVAGHEIIALRLADGAGCARLLRDDIELGALLLERLGPSLHYLRVPIGLRHEILCSAVEQVWRPANGYGLPTGADKGRWLIEFTTRTWNELDRPCSERAIDDAVASAERRIAAHDDERALLVHGDVHEWNALKAGDGFKLVDPDGLLAEPEYDLGVLMREDPLELLEGDAHDRARWLARRCDLDAGAIWDWGAAERVSTGLLATMVGMQPVGRNMLMVADRLASDDA